MGVGWGEGGNKDIYYVFFGKSVLFRLVVRYGFAHFVRKVIARRKLLSGKFWVFAPLKDISTKIYSIHPNTDEGKKSPAPSSVSPKLFC